MKIPVKGLSQVAGTLASAGAIAGTIINAAGAGQIHVAPGWLSVLIGLAWLGQSPLIHRDVDLVAAATASGSSTSTSSRPLI